MTQLDQDYTQALAAAVGKPLLGYQLDLMAAPLNGAHHTGHLPGTVVVLAPRQTGKTSTLMRVMLGRGAARADYRCAYTAQTGTVVSRRFTGPGDGWMSTLTSSQLRDSYDYRRSQGGERIVRKDNGSYLMGFPPVDGALRGEPLDCVTIDEAQEHSAELGAALLDTIMPCLSTRQGRQLIITGTAGYEGSWWHDQYLAAQDGAHLLVELGTWPAEADPADPATWHAHHPGLRAGLTSEQELSSQLALLGVERFAHEHGNRWTPAVAGRALFVADHIWQMARAPHPPDQPAAVAFDVTPDAGAGTIVAVGRSDQGTLVAGIVDSRQGTAWLPAALADLRTRHRVPILCDTASPAGSTADQLRRTHSITVRTLTGFDYVTACTSLTDGLTAGTHQYLPSPEWDQARFAAARRFTDRGGWVWNRKQSTGNITPLVAWTLAAWQATRETARPRIVAATG